MTGSRRTRRCAGWCWSSGCCCGCSCARCAACGSAGCAGSPPRSPCWRSSAGRATALHLATREDVARAVLRDPVEPPFDPLDYPSPLSRYRAYTKDLADTSLFTVDRRADRRAACGWRPWTASTASCGTSAATPRAPRAGSGACARRSATSAGLRSRCGSRTTPASWVPSLGVTESATGADGRGAAGVVGNETGTLAQIGGVTSGATYRLDAVRPTRPSDPEIEAAGDGLLRLRAAHRRTRGADEAGARLARGGRVHDRRLGRARRRAGLPRRGLLQRRARGRDEVAVRTRHEPGRGDGVQDRHDRQRRAVRLRHGDGHAAARPPRPRRPRLRVERRHRHRRGRHRLGRGRPRRPRLGALRPHPAQGPAAAAGAAGPPAAPAAAGPPARRPARGARRRRAVPAPGRRDHPQAAPRVAHRGAHRLAGLGRQGRRPDAAHLAHPGDQARAPPASPPPQGPRRPRQRRLARGLRPRPRPRHQGPRRRHPPRGLHPHRRRHRHPRPRRRPPRLQPRRAHPHRGRRLLARRPHRPAPPPQGHPLVATAPRLVLAGLDPVAGRCRPHRGRGGRLAAPPPAAGAAGAPGAPGRR